MIDQERKKRREAEQKLQKFLVDLYQNPNINKELRSRLPYAKDNDPLVSKEATPNIEKDQSEHVLSDNRSSMEEHG